MTTRGLERVKKRVQPSLCRRRAKEKKGKGKEESSTECKRRLTLLLKAPSVVKEA